MQKKKYFFSLAVFVIMLVGVFGGGNEVRASKYCCFNDNKCAYSNSEGKNCPGGYGCKKCNADNIDTGEDCCDGDTVECTDSKCTAKWCCIIKSGSQTSCTEASPSSTCSGDLKAQVCSLYASEGCGATKGEYCCVNLSNTKDCTEMTSSAGCSSSGLALRTGACTTITTCNQYVDPNSGNGTSSTGSSFVNPLTFDSIDGVLTGLLTALKGFVVTLAIIFIVLGGILYMMSAGDPTMLKRAKDCWLSAVIGLAIVVAAPTFLKQVQEILGGNLTGGGMAEALTIKDIATNVLTMLLSIVGIIAIISLVIAGSMYMTAYGDEKRIETAKKMGTYAIIGIIVALGSLVAVEQIKILITG